MGFLQQASSALTPQSTYTAQVPQIQQQQLIPQINQSQAAIAQNQGNQNALAGQLLAQSQGQGPNLADLQLKAATDRQMQQQAGAVASQKGISPALAQRQIAQQGAAAQQQAAQASGQMRAQQQLQSQGQLGGLYGQIGGQQLQNQGILQGAQQAQNSAINQGTLGAEGINSGVGMANMQAIQGTQGALIGGIGGALGGGGSAAQLAGGAASKWQGGEITKYADGGDVAAPIPDPSAPIVRPWDIQMPGETSAPGKPTSQTGGPQSALGKSLSGAGNAMSSSMSNINAGSGIHDYGGMQSGISQGITGLVNAAKKGAMLIAANQGGSIPKDFTSGGHVPGKAKVKGDNLKNDTVPAVVSPGEVVLPRSVTQSADPIGNASKFLAAVLAHKGKK